MFEQHQCTNWKTESAINLSLPSVVGLKDANDIQIAQVNKNKTNVAKSAEKHAKLMCLKEANYTSFSN